MEEMEQPIKVYVKVNADGYIIPKSFSLYMHINKINNKKYIGITKQNPKYRWRSDGSGYFRSPCFYNAIKKYGWENFEHIILLDNLTEKEAELLEQEYIKKFNTRNNKYGYNMTDGGDGSFNIIVTQETRDKLSKAGKGKKRSLETRQKLSLSKLGKRPTQETLIKLSISHLGHRPNENQKRALQLGSISRLTPIYCEDEFGNRIDFNSIKSASKKFNIPRLNKSFKQIAENHWKCGGYYWYYKER